MLEQYYIVYNLPAAVLIILYSITTVKNTLGRGKTHIYINILTICVDQSPHNQLTAYVIRYHLTGLGVQRTLLTNIYRALTVE